MKAAIGSALVILSLCVTAPALGFEVLAETDSDLASLALDRDTGTFYIFTADYDLAPIPSSGLVTEYRSDGVPIASYEVPESLVEKNGRQIGFDPLRQVFILGGSGSDSPTSDFSKTGEIIFTYGFEPVTGQTGGVNGVDIDRHGVRYYNAGSFDPYFVVALDPSVLHDGDLLPSEASIVFQAPVEFYAGGFTRDFHSGKFLLASGSTGQILEFNKQGKQLQAYSLAGLGFGYAFYHGEEGYFIDDIAIEADGSLLVGAAYAQGEGIRVCWRVLRFSKNEWRSLRDRE